MNRRVLENNHFNKRLDQLIVFRTDDFVIYTSWRPTHIAWFQEFVSFHKNNNNNNAHFWLIHLKVQSCSLACLWRYWLLENQSCFILHSYTFALSSSELSHSHTSMSRTYILIPLTPQVRNRRRIFLSLRQQCQHIEPWKVGKEYL